MSKHHIKLDKRKIKRMKYKVFARDDYTCQECGFHPSPKDMKYQIGVDPKPVKVYLTLDHIIPVSRGGKNQLDNVRTLCNKCNQERGDTALEIPLKIQC